MESGRRAGLRRRAAARVALALGLGVAACSGPARPSVLVLTVDTLRPDYLGRNGYDRPTSPHLDALAARGVYFAQAVAPVARTTPSLASLWTGAYPHTTSVRTLSDRLADDVVPLARVLHDAGYQTVAVVTNHVLSPARGLDRGFERYDVYDDHRTAKGTTDAALERLAALRPDQPGLVWVHYMDPHVPYDPGLRRAVAMDPAYRGPFRIHFGHNRRPGEPPEAHRAFPPALPRAVAAHRNPLPERVNAHLRRLYAAEVRAVDDQVGRLLDALPARSGSGWIVVFAADHGESLGEHGYYWDHGDYVYAAGTRVPLAIVLPPEHPLHARGVCRGWVSLVDLVPTLLELLGRDVPAAMAPQLEGRSLVPCLRGEPLPPRPVFAESGHCFHPEALPRRVRFDLAGRLRAVVQADERGDWKLVWTPFRRGDDAWELYDLRTDPDETRNVYRPGHPALPALRNALRAWLRRDDGTRSRQRVVSERDLEVLRSLGYVEP